jgi:RNA polymerase sigma-70 factor (ECF subfamily)
MADQQEMAKHTDNIETLVALAQGGDHAAFVELVKIEGGRAWAACLAILGNMHDAEDAMQEGTLSAFQSIRTLRDRASFRSWFVRIVANTAKNIRKRRRDAPSLDELKTEPSYDPINSYLDQIFLSDAVGALPEALRSVITLHSSGLKTDEIANVLECPAGTVRRRLSTAYQRLREALETDEADLERQVC